MAGLYPLQARAPRVRWSQIEPRVRLPGQLDTETLVCTRGRAFPLAQLESRLRCPKCGSRGMAVMFEPPTQRASA